MWGLPAAAQPLGTAFTYQGRLTDAGAPANGAYDFEFKLFSAAAAGVQVGSTVSRNDVAVSTGLFVVSLDFGVGPFAGQARFLEIGVRPGISVGAYTLLGSRQELTPAPGAVFASKSADATTVAGLACANGQVAKWSGTAWTCGADADTNSGGTVTSVGSGSGLTGGPVTGTGSLSIAAGGVTTSMIAAGAVGAAQIANGAVGSAQINQAQVQTRLATVCPLGEYLRGVNADGSVVCGTFFVPPTITTVDAPAGSQAGQYTSLAIGTDGFPVISYYNSTAFSLFVAKCVNAACTGASTITNVDPFSLAGTYSSIAIGADGFPVISYYDNLAGAKSLKVAKCVNAACTGVSTITRVDDPAVNQVGFYTSIAIGADGFPVISYQDQTAFSLMVAKCVNAACTGTSTITTVHLSVNQVGFDTSIAIGADGFPVISYRDQTAGSLKVAKCVNAACTGTSTITTVDDPAVNQVGYYTSIAIGADGFPVISYLDGQVRALKVAKCVNAACTGAGTIITTVDDPVNEVGFFTSIAIGADGFPAISYYDFTAGALKVAKCVNAACTGASTIALVDEANSVGWFTSLKIGADGLPVISYQDSTAGTLKVAKCSKPSCAP